MSKEINIELPPVSYEYEHRFRIYAGSSLVGELADRLSQNYFSVILTDDSYVWIETNYSAVEVMDVLKSTGWLLRDIVEI